MSSSNRARPQSASSPSRDHNQGITCPVRPKSAAPIRQSPSQGILDDLRLSKSLSAGVLPKRRKSHTHSKNNRSGNTSSHKSLPTMRRPQSAASYVSKSKKCPDALSRALLSRELYIRTPTIRSSRLPLKEKIKRLETAIIKERAHSPPASRSPSPHQRPPSPIHVPGNNYPPVPESPVVIHNTWVMPCHKSEDEIIAEADYRIRKQLYAKDIQVKVLNGIRTRVDAKLQLRQERIASATEKIELMRRQSTGLTIIQAVRFVYYLSARLKVQRRIDAANRVPVYSFGGTQVVIKTQEDLSKHEEFKEKYIRFLEVAHCNPGGLYSSKCSSEIGYSTTRRESTTEEGQQTVQDNYLRRKCKHLATSHGITTSHSH